jgi:adenine deaminase
MAALIAVARGRAPADMVISGGQVVNLYSEEIYEADIVISAGRIAHVGSQLDAIGDDMPIPELSHSVSSNIRTLFPETLTPQLLASS